LPIRNTITPAASPARRLQMLAELPEQKEASKNDRPEQHDWQPPTLE
jgi:hypothetical protein